MRMRRPVHFLAVALFLAACAQPAPESATIERGSELHATIQTVDPGTREILLRADDGRLLSVVAGPEVRNFDQLEPGDRVAAFYVESIAASMAAPGQAVETRAGAATDRAPEGGRPGAAAGVAIEAVVEWVGYDPESAIATFIGASGLTHSVQTPPEMRAFAAARQPGESVLIEYTAALAVEVEELAGAGG
jgi:hypothetical protein